ncbi:hypothetical protein B484DRAFT_471021 [Ochromonadaceae sp. CCMP2298]|nr:hypothetical protein B484DRAFT_471021 [Ochromonadaceae sp. CCMP2298]
MQAWTQPISVEEDAEQFQQLMGPKPLLSAYAYAIHLGYNSACPNAQQFWAAKFLVGWKEGDDVALLRQVLGWMTESGTIVQGRFHCPQPSVMEDLHDALSSSVVFWWNRADAASLYEDMEAAWNALSFERRKMEEVLLWAYKGQARPDTAMQMCIGQGLVTWTEPTSSSSSSSDPPAVGSPGWCEAVKASIRVDKPGLERFISLFRLADRGALPRCSDVPFRQERAAGLPKRPSSSNVPRRSLEQQQEEGRWDSRNLEDDQALLADMQRRCKIKALMTLVEVEALRAKRRVANLGDEQLEKKRVGARVANLGDEQLEKKRAGARVANLGDEQLEKKRARSRMGNMGDEQAEKKRARSRMGNMGDEQAEKKWAASRVATMGDEKHKKRKKGRLTANLSEEQKNAKRKASRESDARARENKLKLA